MKKIFFLIFTITFSFVYSQYNCEDAFVITNLPFKAYSVNTQFADVDTSAKYCYSSFNHGNDTIFTYTPTSNQVIDIELSNVLISNNSLVQIYLLDNCPTSGTYNCINIATGGDFLIENINITQGETYYILVTNAVYGVNYFTFDIEVRERYNNDLGFYHYNASHSDCNFTSSQEISFFVKNYGLSIIDTIQFGNLINGDYYQSQIYTDTIYPGETKIFYPFYPNLSNFDSINILVFIETPDDNNLNDTINILLHKLDFVDTFPFLTTFEPSDTVTWVSEWFYDGPYKSSWEVGYPNGTVINHPASGNNSCVTTLSGLGNISERSTIISPCLDFTNISIPVIEFDIWKSLDSNAIAYLDYSLDIGATWHKIGTSDDNNNWYNPIYGQTNNHWIGNSNGWIKAKHRLENLAGENHVILRLGFENNTFIEVEGFAIDNIRIYEAPNHDIGVTNILNPISRCNINNDSINVEITNFSPDLDHSNFIIKAVIDDTYEIVDTVTETVQANSTLNYTFKNTYNFNQLKEYKLRVTTYLINEDDTTNDADSISFFNFDNNSLPYFNDFETNNGTWFASGINSSWEYGTPNDSVITDAASGTKAWGTNLAGYHNSPEESYITSSCFDLSLLTFPMIKFKANYDLYKDNGATSSYVQMQYSNDNGLSWIIVGTATENWYDAGSSWIGKSNNWIEKFYDISNLTNLEDIQIRFKLFALQGKTGFAFDDFQLCNMPKASFSYTASGRDILINNTSTNGTSFKWLINDTLTSTEVNPIITVTQDTTHITQIVINDCFSDTITHTIFTSNISKLTNGSITVYPNPTNNYLIIKNNKYHISSIQIINTIGQIKINKKANNESTTKIDVSDLQKGVYLLRIKTNSNSFTERIIIN